METIFLSVHASCYGCITCRDSQEAIHIEECYADMRQGGWVQFGVDNDDRKKWLCPECAQGVVDAIEKNKEVSDET